MYCRKWKIHVNYHDFYIEPTRITVRCTVQRKKNKELEKGGGTHDATHAQFSYIIFYKNNNSSCISTDIH